MKENKSKQFLLKLTPLEHQLLMQKSKELNISASDILRIHTINLLKNDKNETKNNVN